MKTSSSQTIDPVASLSLFLPSGILDYFTLVNHVSQDTWVIKEIDSNIGQLLKTDAKFYAIHVTPSENELRAIGNTEQKLAEAMKHYIREAFIPEYARNFNKGLSVEDIKFYGKIHFNRDRSDNKLNMHCHLIVSRKEQSNKVKISPLTTHSNTKKGVITGGFDRTAFLRTLKRVLTGYSIIIGNYPKRSSIATP